MNTQLLQIDEKLESEIRNIFCLLLMLEIQWKTGKCNEFPAGMREMDKNT